MEKTGIYAGIVSFNPDLDRLGQNVDAILPQVDGVVIFDNGSANQAAVADRFSSRAVILKSEKNLGIAAALNRLMEYCEAQGARWMVSLDQDSVCASGHVRGLCNWMPSLPDAGILAPVIVDRSIGVVGHDPKEAYAQVNTCITSGTMARIDVWRKIGGYDESMFIDSVDFEFCYRVRKAGFQVIQVRDVRLLHQLGNSQKRRLLFWKVTVNGHSAFRKYYIARNNVYYPLKHRLWLHFLRGNLRNAWLMLVVLLYEENKGKKLCAILRGWMHGICKKTASA